METRISTEWIKGDCYRVTHEVDDNQARYLMHKMGEPDHRIAADAHTCNCKAYDISRLKSPVAQCKHTKKARDLDSKRRMAFIRKQRAEIMGEVA